MGIEKKYQTPKTEQKTASDKKKASKEKTKHEAIKVKIYDYEVLAPQAEFLQKIEAQLLELALKKNEECSKSDAHETVNECFGVDEKGNIIELNLHEMGLEKLPPEIGRLKKLRILDCAENLLIELPPEIGKLVELQKLSCQTNLLTELPPEIGNLVKIQELDLFNNKLKVLPEEIGRIYKLKKLNCELNKFDDTEIKRIKKKFSYLSDLKI